MKLKALVLAAAILALLPAKALAWAANTTPPAGMDLFLFTGQSNMSGFTPLPENRASVGNVLVFGNDNVWHFGQEPNDYGVGQVDAVSYDGVGQNSQTGYSSMENFGIAVAQATGHMVGLVPCPRGGSAVTEWQRDRGRDTLYGSCLYRAQQASAYGTVKGLINYQGEAEAAVSTATLVYQPDNWTVFFKAFIYNMRRDLGNMDLPVVLVQIGYEGAPNTNNIRAQQAAIPGSVPKTAVASAVGLETTDGVHLTAASQDTLSQRLATAYLGIINGPPPPTSTPAPATATPLPPTATATAGPATATPTRTNTPVPPTATPVPPTPTPGCTANEITFTTLFYDAPGTTQTSAGTVVGKPPCMLVHVYNVSHGGVSYPPDAGTFVAWAQSTGHLAGDPGVWQ